MKIRHYIFAGAMTLAMTGNALALSCTRDGFDIAKTYNNHAKSDETIMFIVGRFSGTVPKRDNKLNQDQPTTRTNLSFKGSSIGKSGLKKLNKTISVVSTCIGTWCGGTPPVNQKIIAAVNVEGNGQLVLKSGPCSPNQFQGNNGNVRLIQACMKGRVCDNQLAK